MATKTADKAASAAQTPAQTTASTAQDAGATAPEAAPDARKAGNAPIDVGPLSFSEVTDENRITGNVNRSGGRTRQATEFDDILKRSYENGAWENKGTKKEPKNVWMGKEFTFHVPEAAGDQQMNRLRNAARGLNLGVKVRHATNDGTRTIQFQAKDMRGSENAENGSENKKNEGQNDSASSDQTSN